MGEMADMVIDGGMCEWCGTCFREDHGYPVLCNSCWHNATPEERKEHQKATKKDV